MALMSSQSMVPYQTAAHHQSTGSRGTSDEEDAGDFGAFFGATQGAMQAAAFAAGMFPFFCGKNPVGRPRERRS